MSFRNVAIDNDDEFMENIIKMYEKTDNTELEYRIGLDNNLIRSILINLSEDYRDKAELDQTVNFIYKNNRDSDIMRYTFTGVNTYQKDFYKKEKILSAQDSNYENLKLVLSVEQPLKNINTTNLKLIRIKNRIMIPVDIYRFDFTQIIEISGTEFNMNKSTLKSNRLKLFSNLAGFKGKQLYEQYITNLDETCSYELEIEINNPKNIEHLKIQNIINKISILYSTLEASNILSRAASLIGLRSRQKLSIKNVLSKAVTLSKNMYNEEIYPPISYLIGNKADGERAILYINGKTVALLTSNQALSFVNNASYKSTILDCELIDNNLFVFDAIEVDGENVSNTSLENRIDKYQTLDIKFNGYTVLFKKYFVINEDMASSFRKIIDHKFNYPQDGFILSDNVNSYYNTKHYKIKESNTIDFLALELPKELKNNKQYIEKAGYSLYILFCGINKYKMDNLGIKRLSGYEYFFKSKSAVPYKMRAVENRLAIQFSPADNPKAYLWYVPNELNKQLSKNKSQLEDRKGWIIVELEPIFTKDNFEWKFHRIRQDRINEPNYFGNDFTNVAENNWMISQDPLKIKDMHLPVDTYFGSGKNNIYFAQTAAISVAKSQIIQTIFMKQKNGFVLDLASGKGQDLHRYMNAGFEKGLFLEYDRIALATLLARRKKMMNQPGTKNIVFGTNIAVRDLTDPAKEIIDSLDQFLEYKPDFINCNLAMHYLIYDVQHLNNFARIVTGLLNKGGYFAYTSMNGNKIVELLKEKKEWISTEGEITKYHLIKEYESDILTGFGQLIKVKLPFGKYYEESLINHDLVDKLFDKFQLTKIMSGSMLDFINAMSDRQRNALSSEDKKYVDLYSYHVYQFNAV